MILLFPEPSLTHLLFIPNSLVEPERGLANNSNHPQLFNLTESNIESSIILKAGSEFATSTPQCFCIVPNKTPV